MLNLQLELEKLIKNLTYKPKLLIHCCCAPCASYVVEYLKPYFDITLYYYNPNISPYEEFVLRMNETQRLAEFFEVGFIGSEWENELFENASVGLENVPETGSRCDKCFYIRLDKTARLAKEMDFEYFVTSLSISPLKNSQKLNEIGTQISQSYGIKYLPSDFKKKNGYKRSVELSKELSLYRQNYCGCRFSKMESERRAELKNNN